MSIRFESEVRAVEADVIITRTLNAPRELVFQMWTDPQHLPMWWGPDGFSCTRCEMDVQVGGRFHLELCGPDGARYPCDGVYREILAPERIVYEGMADEGHPCGAGLPPYGRVTISFTEHAGMTTLQIHAKLRSVVDREAAVEGGFGVGWGQSLARLARHLSLR